MASLHTQLGRFRRYFSSPEMDGEIEEARAESRPAFREKLYAKIENFLIDTGLVLPLFHEIDYRVANPKVRKLSLRSSPPIVNYSEIGTAATSAAEVSRKAGGGMIHVAIPIEINTLDPFIVQRVSESEVIPNIFETLTRETDGARIIPWLASEFHAEDGGRSYRFRLREGVRFHDGRRITARDVCGKCESGEVPPFKLARKSQPSPTAVSICKPEAIKVGGSRFWRNVDEQIFARKEGILEHLFRHFGKCHICLSHTQGRITDLQMSHYIEDNTLKPWHLVKGATMPSEAQHEHAVAA